MLRTGGGVPNKYTRCAMISDRLLCGENKKTPQQRSRYTMNNVRGVRTYSYGLGTSEYKLYL